MMIDEVLFNREISEFEKVLFFQIWSLSDKEAICRLSNKQLAKKAGKCATTISHALSNLNKKGFIDLEYIKGDLIVRKIKIIGGAPCKK